MIVVIFQVRSLGDSFMLPRHSQLAVQKKKKKKMAEFDDEL